jgi:hypothetical protein
VGVSGVPYIPSKNQTSPSTKNKRKKLSSPNISTQNVMIDLQKRNKGTRTNFSNLSRNLVGSRSKSRSKFFPPNKRQYRPISYKASPSNGGNTRKYSPVRSPNSKKFKNISPHKTYSRFSRSPNKKKHDDKKEKLSKIRKYKQSYYDKHPELYVKMMKRFEGTGNDNTNSWNLEGPAFASYLPSNRTVPSPVRINPNQPKPMPSNKTIVRTPQRKFYQNKNPIETMNWDKTKPRTNYTNTEHAPVPNQNIPEPIKMHSEQIIRTRPNNGILDNQSSPRRQYSVNGGSSPFEGKRSGSPKRNVNRGRQVDSKKVHFENKKVGGDGGKKGVKLDPLQFCNFCDNYFHEKCFNDYFEKNK